MGACLGKDQADSDRENLENIHMYDSNEEPDPSMNDIYSFTFPSKPLGMSFNKTKYKKNLYVAALKPQCAAKGKVSIGSIIIKIQNETVQDIGSENVWQVLTKKYANDFPLKITFGKSDETVTRKPEKNKSKPEPEPELEVIEKGVEGTPAPQNINENKKDIYSHKFTSKPLGLAFGKTKDKNNLCVTDVDEGVADGKIVLGSIVVQFQDEIVENKGAKTVYKTFQNKYSNLLPLTITFRKPANFKETLNGLGDEFENGNPTQAFQNVEEKEIEDKEEEMTDVYSFGFTQKPFGLVFEKTKDGKNLWVKEVEKDSTANGKIEVGSVIIKFQNEKVENLGAKKIYKIFAKKYAEQIPLIMTFRKAKMKDAKYNEQNESDVENANNGNENSFHEQNETSLHEQNENDQEIANNESENSFHEQTENSFQEQNENDKKNANNGNENSFNEQNETSFHEQNENDEEIANNESENSFHEQNENSFEEQNEISVHEQNENSLHEQNETDQLQENVNNEDENDEEYEYYYEDDGDDGIVFEV